MPLNPLDPRLLLQVLLLLIFLLRALILINCTMTKAAKFTGSEKDIFLGKVDALLVYCMLFVIYYLLHTRIWQGYALVQIS